MGVTATLIGDWQGGMTGGYQTAVKVAGLPAPPDGYIYQRKRNVYNKWRWVQGMTAFTSDAGDIVVGDDQTTINGPDAPTYGGEPNAIITAHEIEPAPSGSGIWIEKQVIEGYTAWEEIPIPT